MPWSKMSIGLLSCCVNPGYLLRSWLWRCQPVVITSARGHDAAIFRRLRRPPGT